MSAAVETFADRDAWLTARRAAIGGSEVAALLGACPRRSYWRLWMEKAGRLEADGPDPDDAARGLQLEPAVLRWAAEREGWRLGDDAALSVYRDAAARLAGTPDAIVSDSAGDLLVEVKTVRGHVWRGWGEKPSLPWMAQLQHYLMLTGLTRGRLAVMVDLEPPQIWTVDARPDVHRRIRKAAAIFWALIDADQEPNPDFGRDGGDLAKMMRGDLADRIADLSLDNRAPLLVDEYLAAAAMKREGEARAKAASAELLAKLTAAGAKRGRVGDVRLSVAEIAAAEIPATTRAAYRRLTVTPPKGEAA